MEEREIKRLFLGDQPQRYDHVRHGRLLRRLMYALDNELVDLEPEHYKPAKKPDRASEPELFRNYQAAFRKGNDEHSHLKWYAWNWCYKEYGEEPEYEEDLNQRFVSEHDVIARKSRVAIECGSTVHFHLAYESFGLPSSALNSFALFPRGTDRLYRFTPSLDGEDILRRHGQWVHEWADYEILQREDFERCWTRPENPGEPANLGSDEPP